MHVELHVRAHARDIEMNTRTDTNNSSKHD